MPEGGTLLLTAESVRINEIEASRYPGEAIPGEYVRLSIADTGTGMTPEVRARSSSPSSPRRRSAREPAWGCRWSRGSSSSIGAGSPAPRLREPVRVSTSTSHRPTGPPRTYSVLRSVLPAAAPPAPRLVDSEPELELDSSDNRPTVLLVDDEEMIRDIGRAVLDRAGYRVLTADDGAEAVDVFSRERERVSLVILDVTMPRMSGRDAFRQLVKLKPSAGCSSRLATLAATSRSSMARSGYWVNPIVLKNYSQRSRPLSPARPPCLDGSRSPASSRLSHSRRLAPRVASLAERVTYL